MLSHASHLLQPLDVGCFAVVKHAYSRFISDLAHRGYNHIDKFDFLDDYEHARLEAFQKPYTIQNSFAASGLVPVNAERVLSKLNISLRTPTPPSSRPSCRSSQFTPTTPRTIAQLYEQSSMLKDLLDWWSQTPTPLLDQIVKGCAIVMHSTALLSQENTNLRAANEKEMPEAPAVNYADTLQRRSYC